MAPRFSKAFQVEVREAKESAYEAKRSESHTNGCMYEGMRERERERDFYDFSNKGHLPLGNKTFYLCLFKREVSRER